MARIPYDFEEFVVFIKEFAAALKDKGRDDEFLVKAGESLAQKAEQLVVHDTKAKEYAALKKQENQTKYALMSDTSEEASRCIGYLEFKLGKTSTQLEDFNIKPRKR